MNKEQLININGIREDLYQAMQIGDITLNSKHSQELYDFMNYQDKEIERLNNKNEELLTLYTTEREVKDYYKNIINELENIIDIEINKMGYAKYDSCLMLMKMKIQELKGSDKE